MMTKESTPTELIKEVFKTRRTNVDIVPDRKERRNPGKIDNYWIASLSHVSLLQSALPKWQIISSNVVR